MFMVFSAGIILKGKIKDDQGLGWTNCLVFASKIRQKWDDFNDFPFGCLKIVIPLENLYGTCPIPPTEAKFLIFDMDDFGLRCFMVLSGISTESPDTLDIGRLELG